MKERAYTLDELARYKYEFRRAISEEIAQLRRDRQEGCFSALFAADAQSFATSSDLGLVFDEQSYAYNQPYKGSRKFNKHYFPIIGDLKADGEEFECAVYLDEHVDVRYWVRNVDQKINAFWLQLSNGRFYPDFVVMLNDGRILAVEYKGGHLMTDAEEKRIIGRLWAEASDGHCLFVMPTKRQFGEIDQVIKGS